MPKDDPNGSAMPTTVVPSDAMVPPSPGKMRERRAYPVQKVPPIAHARAWYDPQSQRAGLTYNGADLLTFRFPEDAAPRLRYHSDGNFCAAPFQQQFVLQCPEETAIEVTLAAPVPWWNMRPRRAQGGEALLGQVGAPLLYGVNGLYMPDWDLLTSWHGYAFAWQAEAVQHEDGLYRATMTLTVGKKPWVVLFRPRYYGEHLGFDTHRPWDFRPNPRPITGWCSWEAYHSKVTQQNIDDAAKALQPLRPYGLEIMQLDDGFQQTQVPMAPGVPVGESWTRLNDKFPDGHAGIVGAMTGGGFEAGIWTNATLTNREACEAADFCLRDAHGQLIFGDWIQYVLDCKPETLASQTTPYYRAFREAGYTYFKSDSLRHLLYDGMQEAVRMGLMDNETARARQRAYMEAAREGIGEDAYYLSCWGMLTTSVGVCDAMRIATDSNPKWGSFSMQLRETARWYGAQRVLFTLDPDVVCVRGPLPWARMLLSLVALTGGLMMVSDDTALYDAERLALIQRTIPGLATHAGETGPIDYTTPACCSVPEGMSDEEGSFAIAHTDDTKTPIASLWCTHFDEGGRRWAVMQRCAVVPLETLCVDLAALSLDPGRRYVAFDYWQQQPVPVVDGKLSLPALALGDTTVLSIVEVDGATPRLVASDRHVSMDTVSVTETCARPDGIRLSLRGFAGLVVRYTLYAPALAGQTRQDGCTAACTRQGDFLTVTVTFAGEDAWMEVE